MQHVRIYTNALTAQNATDLFAAARTNEVLATINTNDLICYYSLKQDDHVRNYGYGTNSVFKRPTVANSSTWTLDGTNTIAGVNFGRQEDSQDFDGTDDYMQLHSDAGFSEQTNGYSIGVWVNRDQDDDIEAIIAKQAANDSVVDWRLYFDNTGDGRIVIDHFQQGSTTDYIGRAAPDFNSGAGWVHVCITKADGSAPSDFIIYTNGVACDNADVTNGTVTAVSYSASAEVRIGRFSITSGNLFDGQLDDIKFFAGVVLTPAQVLTLANRTGLQGTPIPDNRDQNGYNYANDQ
jgi:hypothetical protein